VGRNVSIKDLAQAAGVSHTTVSRALRNSPLISKELRLQIHQLARDMDYVPNTIAQSLKNRRTATIGVVVTTISDPFVGRVVRGIEDVAQRERQSVILSASYNDPEREREIIQTFHQRRVDGILLESSSLNGASAFSSDAIPTVLINPQAEIALENVHSVAVDDELGARLAVEFLVRLGHRSIGFIGAGNRPRSNRIRRQAYHAALHAAGIEPPESWERSAPADHRYHSDDVADGQQYATELVNAGVSAIFCYNDMFAVGALLACRACGVHVPEDLSIIGFDDIELAQYVSPALTTVHQPKLLLGQCAMGMLMDLLAGSAVQNTTLEPELVLRASTTGPPGNA
jgi:DNA-binding LacI/PurR family transcriptional regulator